jgi:hypothetical protein
MSVDKGIDKNNHPLHYAAMVQLLAGFILVVLVALVVVVLGGGGVLVYGVTRLNNEANALMATIDISARVDSRVCTDQRYPIVVTRSNRNAQKTVSEISFSIRGYRPGYSKSVAESLFLGSDKILKPGESHTDCWSITTGATTTDISALEWRVELHHAR